MAEEDTSTQSDTQSDVQDAGFPDMSGSAEVEPTDVNLDMVRDIEVTMTVELGRTGMVIEEILGLTTGKVIELEKLAGEPLDILINGQLLARGEVVVVDENFGVRVTSIIDPRSRVKAMAGEASSPIVDTDD